MAANKENERESENAVQSTSERRSQIKNDEAIQNSVVPPRDPLRTLASKNVDNIAAGPSQKTVKKLNTRLVTHRNDDEEFNCNVDKISAGPSQKTVKKLGTRFVTHRDNDEESNCSVDTIAAGQSQKTVIKLDTRFVTFRNNEDEEFDWNHEVFRDNLNKSLFKHGIKDDLYRELECLQSNAQNTIEVTPAVGTSILRKVKKSLKRPQSRGQRHEVSGNSSKTHCPSSIEDLNDEYVLDNLNYLLESEKKIAGEPMLRKASRTCVINWIININGSSGSCAVVQTACWYLDNYLSLCLVSVSNLQVIAAACFWIATKLIGHNVTSRRLVKYSGQAFTEKDLVAAEKNVLKKVVLKFQSTLVVADDFIPYLSYCCDESGSGLVEAASTFICQCGIMTEKLFSEDYPSVIALAAVLTALELLKKNAWKDKLKECVIFKAIEDKAGNIKETCNKLRESMLTVSSVGYEYKAPIFKFRGPPHYITTKIVHAITHKEN